MTVLQPITRRPETVTDQAYKTIREAIVSRQFTPGQRIVEATLAEQLGVSKTPVREALLRLMNVGLVESDGTNRGGRVVTPSLESIRAAYEIRMALEVESARIVAERANADVVKEIREHATSCLAKAEKGDRDGFRELDRIFHFALSEATNNETLARLTSDAFDLTWALRLRDAPMASSGSLECGRQHLEVVNAIENKDADTAGSAMRAHIAKVESLVLDAFGDSDIE